MEGHLLQEYCVLVADDQDAVKELLSQVWEKHRAVPPLRDSLAPYQSPPLQP